MTSLEKALKFVRTSSGRPILSKPWYSNGYIVGTDSYVLYACKENMGDIDYVLPPSKEGDGTIPEWEKAIFPKKKNILKGSFELYNIPGNNKFKDYMRVLKSLRKLTNDYGRITLYHNGAIKVVNKDDKVDIMIGEKTNKYVNLDIGYLIKALSITELYVKISFQNKGNPIIVSYQSEWEKEFTLIMPLKN